MQSDKRTQKTETLQIYICIQSIEWGDRNTHRKILVIFELIQEFLFSSNEKSKFLCIYEKKNCKKIKMLRVPTRNYSCNKNKLDAYLKKKILHWKSNRNYPVCRMHTVGFDVIDSVCRISYLLVSFCVSFSFIVWCSIVSFQERCDGVCSAAKNTNKIPRTH